MDVPKRKEHFSALVISRKYSLGFFFHFPLLSFCSSRFPMSDRTCSRPIQSCFQCRKRKIKCNREYPCAPCILRGESEICREVDRSATSSGKSTMETLDDVVNRVAVLEKIVSRLSKFLPPDLLLSLTASAAKSLDGSGAIEKLPAPLAPSSLPTHEEGYITGVRFLCGSTSSDEEIAMMLEDFAMGNRINRHRAALELELLESSSAPADPDLTTMLGDPSLQWDSATATATNMNLFDPGFDSLPTGPLAILIDPCTNVIQRLVLMLPDESRSRGLIQFYFDRIEWYTKIFHYPSFMADANEVFNHISYPGTDDLNSGSGGQISLSFLSTLFMVICLGLHLIEPEICQRFNIGIQEATALSKKLYSAAQACLWVDSFWSNHTLEAVQCLLLMGVYQKNLDEADSHWALLGSAIKIAQNLGLSRLGSENENRVYTGPWKSIVRREIGRRVWWNLIFNDWSHAAAHNGSYSIHPAQNCTGLPANINDSDLVEGRELLGNDHQYTEMTFSLTRFQFVEIYREIIDMGYGYNLSFVAETDTRLRDMLERIPSEFRHTEQSIRHHPIKQETMGVREMETLLALIMGETRRMRLHRPYLYRGYTDRKYERSTEQCIDSARAVLHYLKSTPDQSTIFLKWWLVMFYGFGAAVVLFIDLCHLRSENPAAVESRRVELQEALNLFKVTQNASTVSQNAIALLEGMLAVSEPRVNRKRGAETNEPMERIAKRIMVECHTSCSSNMAASALSIENQGACDSVLKTECRTLYDHGQSQSQPHPDAQWYQSPISPTSNEWNASGTQGMFFGPEFDDAAINELGQLLWTAEPTSVHVQNPKPLVGNANVSWVHHNQNLVY